MTIVIGHLVDHRFTKAHASEFIDEELTASERARVERHLSACPGCRELLASLRRMIEALSTPAGAPGLRVTEGVLERLRREG